MARIGGTELLITTAAGAVVVVTLLLVRLVAELAAARRQLSADVARHRRIVASLPDAAVLAFDRDLRYTAAEGPALELVGWSRADLAGRTLHEVMPPGRAAALEAHYRRALTGETVTFETRSQRGGRDFSVEVAPMRDRAGVVVGGVVVARDVTEARRAERDRQDAEARFETAFDAAPIGMAMLALDGTFLRVNAALGRMLERPHHQLVGLPVDAVLHGADRAADRAERRALVAGQGHGYRREQRLRTAAGADVDTLHSVSVVRDERGRPLYLLAQTVDITDRRRAEARLRHLADHDPLTGLLNARRFRELLGEHVEAARRGAPAASVVMVDLDRFKLVNDRFGHGAGDALLRTVADVLRGRLRDSDVVARLGGDEFAILLPATTVAQAGVVAGHLTLAIADHGLVGAGGDAVQVTGSAGAAAVEQAAEAVLAEADGAMYASKRAAADALAGRS
jgi:diguanylate cyclase (GGDEF)-like protein/PAS domain S-box-containing protein